MSNWYMITLVGEDRPGIVAALTDKLYAAGCHLGEASMIRLGGNFTIMVMVRSDAAQGELETLLAEMAQDMRLRIHVDAIEGGLHRHLEPDVQIAVHGADRSGIVARVTNVLAKAGLNILELESDVGGTDDKPIYIMVIDGQALEGVEALEAAVQPLHDEGIEVSVHPVETLIG